MCACKHIFMHIYVCMHEFTHVYTYDCMHALYMHVCIFQCLHACMYLGLNGYSFRDRHLATLESTKLVPGCTTAEIHAYRH